MLLLRLPSAVSASLRLSAVSQRLSFAALRLRRVAALGSIALPRRAVASKPMVAVLGFVPLDLVRAMGRAA